MRLVMARMPNQIDGEHYGLLEQIARCRRLAKEVHDQVKVERLLALAAEYERKLTRSRPNKSEPMLETIFALVVITIVLAIIIVAAFERKARRVIGK
jgi:hypothetical protein